MKNLFRKLGGMFLGLAVLSGVFVGINSTKPQEANATKVTDYTSISNGDYYIGATSSSTDYYLSVTDTSIGTSKAGTAITTKSSATVFTFNGSGTSWKITVSNGNYLYLKSSKDNGKVAFSSSVQTFTASNQTSLIRLTMGDYSLQKNKSGTQFGSYGNTGMDVWLEAASSKTVSTVDSVADGHPTQVYQNSSISGNDVTLNVTYSDSSTGTEKAHHVNVDTSKIATGVTATAWYTSTETDNTKKATFTVDVIAEPTYEEKSSFSAISGKLDTYISYAATKGDGTTTPAIYTSKIRLYKPSSGKSTGGILTLSASDYLITDVQIKSNKDKGFKYSIDGGSLTEISATSSSSLFMYEINNIEATSVSFYNIYTDSNEISYIKVTYKEKIVVVPTKAVVSLVAGKGSYYNGTSTSNNKFSTTHITVVTKDDDGNIAATYSNGTGFKVTINGSLKDATSAVQEISFEGVTAGNYTISVTVVGVGAGETDVNNSTQSPAVSVTVIAKQVVQDSFTWDTGKSPKTTFNSHLESLAFKGTPKVSYNDGTSAIASEKMKFELFSGSSASGTALFALTDTNETSYDEKIYKKLTSDNGLIINSGLSFCENSTILKYNSSTQFTYRITLINYTQNNTIIDTVTVNPITLSANDSSGQTYYVDGTYSMSAIVTAAGQTLDSSQYIINNGNSFTPSVSGDQQITVAMANDSDKTTTYTVSVSQPTVPTNIEIMLADDYKAGENFHLGFDAEVTFQGGSKLDVPEDSSELSYSLVDSNTSSFDINNLITVSTPMRKTFIDKFVIARYTIGVNYVDSDPQQINVINNANIEEYTPSTGGNYNLISSLSDVTTGDYLLVYSNKAFDGRDTNNGYTSVTITNNSIAYSTAIAKSSVHITKDSDSYSISISETNDYNAKKYISGTSGSNKLNFTDSIQNVTIQKTTSTDRGTDGFDIFSNTSVFSYNSASDQERFRFYKSNSYTSYHSVNLYKQASSGSGNPVTYLKSVIDAYRLNNETKENKASICNADTSIYSTSEWSKAKTTYQGLKSSELTQLSVQDKFGEINKTYVNTYDMLIAKEPGSINNDLNPLSLLTKDGNQSITIIIIITLMGLTAIGGYFFYKKRKEN